jgi:hypothetical protein
MERLNEKRPTAARDDPEWNLARVRLDGEKNSRLPWQNNNK